MRKYKDVKKTWKYLLFSMSVYVVCMASEPYFSKIIFDKLEGALGDPGSMMTIVYLLVGWVIMSLGIMVGRYYYSSALLDACVDDWIENLMCNVRDIIKLPIHYHISTQNAEKIKLIDRGAEAVWEVSDIFLLEVIPQIALTMILVGVAIWIHSLLTLIALIFLPFAIFISYHYGKTAHENQKKADQYWDKAFGRIGDSFTNISIIKLYAREKKEQEFKKSLYLRASAQQLKVRRFWSRLFSFSRIIHIIPRIITLAAAIYFYSLGEISLGTIFFFFIFVDALYTPIHSIIMGYQRLMESLGKYYTLIETLILPSEKDTGNTLLTKIEKNIIFSNITFSYPSNSREVLRNISIEIKKGQRIALVGHTGSGKSTITQLLMRFYEPTSGKIMIDGTDIYDYTLESYRSGFAAVFQDTTLFNETIRHNLEYVRDDLTEKDLEQACQDANILDFIQSLPNGWETEVGERGLKLSGGEKQRIAIARAILADPEILILDEATSALDTHTERLVQEAFDRLMQDRTSIIIAHRLSTIQSADMIYLIDHGEIVAKGSHTELYQKSKEYKEMVDLQHDGFVGDEEEETTL